MSHNTSTLYVHWIDVAKGLGIIAVVMSHGMFPFHMMLDGFHMQLFFILAGYTFSAKVKLLEFVKKKTLRLVMPYLFWSLFVIIGINPGTLWFLRALIPSLFVFYFIVKYIPKCGIAIFALLMAFLFWGKNSFQDYLHYEIVRILITQVFLSVGYLFRNLIDTPPHHTRE